MPFRRGLKRGRSGRRGRQARRVRFRFGRKKNTSSGKGVTTQHDQRLIYRKKSMPGRKKRNWKRFTKKIHAVSEKALGAQSVVFNKSVLWVNSTPQKNIVASLALYSNKSATFTHLNDLTQIYGRHQAAGTTTTMQNVSDIGVGSNLNDTSKIIFQSAVMDVTFRNVSGNVDGTLSSEMTLEVDVYELSMGANANDVTFGAFADIQQAFTQGLNATSSIGQQGNAITIGDRGVTPFECPQAMSVYRIKVLKKTKYFMPNGGTFTYQMRDPGRHSVLAEKIVDRPGCNVPGLTKWIYVIAKSVPGIVLSTTKSERLEIGMTRKYMYKIRGEPSRRHLYLNV